MVKALARLQGSESRGECGCKGFGGGGCCEPDSRLPMDEFDETLRCRRRNDWKACSGSLEQCVGKSLMTRRQHKECGC
jgi:hypothetical protein